MSKNQDDEITPEDELKAENELLKLKIEMEHGGMWGGGNSAMPPDIENEFLKNIMQFEEQYKNVKQISVYDFIGKPAFKPLNELSGTALETELNRLIDLMNEKGIGISFACEYDNAVIYQFITEELFKHEIDDMHIDGMMIQFIYEEFHPNHDIDLRHYADEFIENLLEREWDDEHSTSELASITIIDGKEYDNAAFSRLVKNFRASFTEFEINEWRINSVAFDLENNVGSLNAFVSYYAYTGKRDFITMEGNVRLGFEIQWDYWHINSVEFPGLHSGN